MTKFIITIALLYRLVWNMFVIGGAVYLIQWQNWNPWWLLLAVLLMVNGSSTKEEKDEDDDDSHCGC